MDRSSHLAAFISVLPLSFFLGQLEHPSKSFLSNANTSTQQRSSLSFSQTQAHLQHPPVSVQRPLLNRSIHPSEDVSFLMQIQPRRSTKSSQTRAHLEQHLVTVLRPLLLQVWLVQPSDHLHQPLRHLLRQLSPPKPLNFLPERVGWVAQPVQEVPLHLDVVGHALSFFGQGEEQVDEDPIEGQPAMVKSVFVDKKNAHNTKTTTIDYLSDMSFPFWTGGVIDKRQPRK